MNQNMDTVLVRGSGGHREHGSYRDIHMSIAYVFQSLEEAEQAVRGEIPRDVYVRYSSENHRQVEDVLTYLEGGEATQVFGSGMGAIEAVINGLSSRKRVIVSLPLYSTTYQLFKRYQDNWGLDVVFLDAHRFVQQFSAMDLHYFDADYVYLETPANSTMDIIDIKAVSTIIKMQQVDTLLIIDNTVATPYNQKPLKLGARVVLESLTKGFTGHGDVIAGSITTSKDIMSRIPYGQLGAVLSPEAAYRCAIEMETFSLRMRTHNANALMVAQFLYGHPKIKAHALRYSGLVCDPAYHVAVKQMKGGGGMISFELAAQEEMSLRRFFDFIATDSEGVIDLAVSLGTTRSKIQRPYTMTHQSLSPEEKELQRITPWQIRLWVGIEDITDIIGSLERALVVV